MINEPVSSNEEGSNKRLCPSVLERYFTKYYAINLPTGFQRYQDKKCSNFNDVCILRHSNKLRVITLALTHPVIKDGNSLTVTNVSYKVTDRLDHSTNHVSGKRKRGAHWLNPSTPLCILTCSDGSRYTVYSGTRGKLIEINDRLVADASLLQQSYTTEGFLAIIMPKITESVDDLLTDEDYKNYCEHSSSAV